MSLFVLLPNRKDGLAALEEKLSLQMLHEGSRQMVACPVDLSLPRFRITWGPANLRSHLIALGMPLAFNPLEANFSMINGHEPPDVDALSLSAVWHKTFVEVHEEGTEAAASSPNSCRSACCRSHFCPRPRDGSGLATGLGDAFMHMIVDVQVNQCAPA